jgi:glycosyltransferase involved in cell wall biosynthesis
VRKGFHLLKDALKTMDPKKVGCLVAGKFKKEQLSELAIEVKALGSLNKSGMIQAYNAADVFVIPSLEENLPNTVLESLSCGTPVAGFCVGGIPEMVSSGKNGFLSETLSAKGLAMAIQSTITLAEMNPALPEICTNSVERFKPAVIAEKYIKLIWEASANK